MSRRTRIFIAIVVACGAAVAIRCGIVLAREEVPSSWVLFAALTVASGIFTLKMPSVNSYLSISELFAFACVLLYGPEAGAVTLAVDGLIVSARLRQPVARIAFNFCNLLSSVWVAGSLFFAIPGIAPMWGQAPTGPWLVPAIGAMAIAFFTINSGVIAIAVALEASRSPLAVWREHFVPLGPSYLAAACVALLMVVAFRELQIGAIALILPLLLISYLTVRSTFGRVEDAERHVGQLNHLLFSTVETLATAIDAKDEVTHDHVRRVQQAALALARELGVRDDLTLKAIEAAALLHDTGKIAVPEHILNKPGKLTPAEFEKMKQHAPIGAEILSSIEFPYPVVPIVRHHHENWNGTGYPDGLSGTNIPLGARILSVVDCYDALTSDRPYRRAMSDEDATKIILDRRGNMYDPLVVDTFLAARERIMPERATELHPVARALGDARAQQRESDAADALPVPELAAADELLAVSSLARALTGEAGLHDAGALLWTMLRPVLPCQSMALFVHDETKDALEVRYAAGAHAASLRGLRCTMGSGVAGWAAVNRRAAVNADPAMDLGFEIAGRAPALLSAIALPLLRDGSPTCVLALYADRANAFTDDHRRLLELFAPHLSNALAPLVSPAPARRPSADLRMLRGGRSA